MTIFCIIIPSFDWLCRIYFRSSILIQLDFGAKILLSEKLVPRASCQNHQIKRGQWHVSRNTVIPLWSRTPKIVFTKKIVLDTLSIDPWCSSLNSFDLKLLLFLSFFFRIRCHPRSPDRTVVWASPANYSPDRGLTLGFPFVIKFLREKRVISLVDLGIRCVPESITKHEGF